MTAFTLFGALGIGALSTTARLTIGVQFSVTTPVPLTGVQFESPPGAGGLPSAVGVFDLGTGLIVAGTQINSPSWSGGGAGGGLNTCSYGSPVTLATGKNYQCCVFCDGSVSANWFNSITGYWTTGPGSAGITSGPLSAPNNASSAAGQDMVQSGGVTITLPNISENGKNYGVSPIVTVTPPVTSSASVPGAAVFVPALIAAGII